MIKEGWTWLSNANTKWHYFRNGESLCGRWMIFSVKDEDMHQGNDQSPDNCKACMKALQKEKANETANS